MTEKEQQALKVVKKYMWWSMGAGLIPVPFVDLAAVAGAQLKMLAEVSKIYGAEFQANRGKAFVASLAGGAVPGALSCAAAGSVLKAVPVLGEFVGAPSLVMLCGASTYALGKVFIQHFESGGTFLSFDPARVKEHFERLFQEGKTLAAKLAAEKEAGTAA